MFGTPFPKYILLAAILFVVASCATSSGTSEKDEGRPVAEEASELRLALSFEPETLDPGKASGAPEGRVAFNLFEGLLAPAPTTEGAESIEDLVRPGVAKSFDVSDDGKTYTFHLREDARWSNGEHVTADDFVYAWKRILTPGFDAKYATMLFVIEGAEAYKWGKIDDWDTVGVHAEDPRTLVVKLAERTPWFPELVSFYTFFPVPREVVEENGEDWTRPEVIVTNGAYSLTDYTPREQLLLEANPHYWDRDTVSIERVVMRIIPDRLEAVAAFESGEVDWAPHVPWSALDEVDADKYPLLGTYFFRINVAGDADAAPLRDARVRRALSLALNREELLGDAIDGRFEPAHSMVPPQMPGYEPPTSAVYDPDKARRLLAEAGFRPGDEMPSFTLLYNTDESHKRIAERARAMWHDELGVKVELENVEWKDYLFRNDRGEYQVARAGWIGDFHSPLTFLDQWRTDGANNWSGWSNQRYDELIEQARQTADPVERAARYREAEEILLEEAAVIPVYFYSNYVLISEEFFGLEPHARGMHLIKYLSPK